jgi:MraZ protein
MFLGEFVHTIDDKGRLTIPARFRGELATGLVITRGLDRCLAIYPIAEWERFAEKVKSLPITDRNARAFRRLVFASAADATPDKQGRVVIPPNLRNEMGLTNDVVVTGLIDYIEIWNPDEWQNEREVAGDVDPEHWSTLGI